MNPITTDASWQQLFAGASGVTPVHDSDGKLLGYFSPVDSANAPFEYEAIAASNDPEEMKRRREYQGKWFSTAEVLEHLKSLGK